MTALPTSPAKCPRCVRLRRTLHEQTPGWCPHCQRWQFLFQAAFRTFGEATYQHLGCVACEASAWCRDVVQRSDAGGCAYFTHVHGLDDACAFGRLLRGPTT